MKKTTFGHWICEDAEACMAAVEYQASAPIVKESAD